MDYDRLSLWHQKTQKRVTLDFNCHFRQLNKANGFLLDDKVIIEVKHHDRADHSCWGGGDYKGLHLKVLLQYQQ
ncbi:MAG: hypothetical protein HRU20_28195, partial [Pseudomonadales bacterium]|nr:hypothetical protein [Pseudomonadales bacterium]